MKMFIIMFIAFLPGVAILIAVDKTADGPNNGIPGIGLSNLPEKSHRLYAHALVMDMYTVIALFLLYRLYKKVSEPLLLLLIRYKSKNLRNIYFLIIIIY